MSAEAKIREEIVKTGFITVDKFMEIALTDNEHGYYIKKNPLGAENDFITSPEISVLFGEMIGLFIVEQIRKNLSKYDKISLIEMGAGKGTLLNDVLSTIIKFSDVYQKLDIVILEINEVLVEIQKKTLKDHINTINWVKNIEDISSISPCIFLANEFFDALPVKQFVKQNDDIKERIIRLKNNDFEFSEIEAQIPEIIANFSEDYSNGDIIEYSPDSIYIFTKLCELILKNKGFAIIIDYGHANFASGDTLQSLYKHKYNNIFDHIGEADLTTHVNFCMLYNEALRLDLKDLYLQTQGDFLRSLGILTRVEMISKNLGEKEKKDFLMRANRLLSSEEMGDLFKCLILESF